MSIHFYDEYIQTAIENVPEEMRENEHFQEALGYLNDVIENYERNYLDMYGDEYQAHLHHAREEGASDVKDRIGERLKEIQYRAVLFQEELDIERLMDEVHEMEVRHENYS